MATGVGTGSVITFPSGFDPDLLSVTGPGLSRPKIDMTKMDSSAAREAIIGELYDGGEFSADIIFDPAAATTPVQLITEAAGTYKIAFGAAGTGSHECSFSGACIGFEPTAAVEERMTASITVAILGAVTWGTT